MLDLYKSYEVMMNDKTFGREDKALSNARTWIAECMENPFELGTQAYELFFQAKKCYNLWTSGGINSRVSGRRCEKYLKQLMDLEMPNPHKQIAKKEEPKKEAKEPTRILGVIPEAKADEPTEEKKEEKHGFFGGRSNKKR